MDNVVYADCVLINGKVATVDAHFSFKRAIAVKQGWIINVGEDQDIQQHIGPQTQVIDLGGKLILPAAHDSHIHIGWLADSWHCLNCQDVRSLAVLRERLRDQAARTPAGAWIRVCGLDPNAIKECAAEQRSLTRWDIDDVTADHPTLLALWDGHSCIVNSRALALSGLDASTPDAGCGPRSLCRSARPAVSLLRLTSMPGPFPLAGKGPVKSKPARLVVRRDADHHLTEVLTF